MLIFAFTDTGFTNWKKALERFEQHSRSDAHREVLMKINFLNQPFVSVQLDTQHKKEQAVRRAMFLLVLSSLKYLVRQGLALRNHNEIEGNLMQLLLLCTSAHPELKGYINDGKYLSHDVLNELVSMMGMRALNGIFIQCQKKQESIH